MATRPLRGATSILRRLSSSAAPLAVAIAVLAASPALGAADVTRSADGKTLTIAFPDNGAADALDVESESASSFVMSEVGPDDLNNPVPSAGSGCAPVVGQAGAVRCSVLALTKLVIDLGDGDDDTLFTTWTLSQIQTVQLGGPGADFLVGTPFFDRLEGGAGGDTLDDRLGGSVLLGGAGSDRFVLGQGDDDVQGGPDFDVADFDGAATGVDVTLDDISGDGPAGDTDNIHSDVEDVVGSIKADHIVGNGEANVLAGDQGADVIEGGGGFDRLEGGSGADRILARDGNAERVDCDDDIDAVIGDTIDALADCEQTDLSPEFVPDLDGDGAARPADCNDADPAVHPGAAEVPDNGIDDDCDGIQGTDPDRDRDGVPVPADCDDRNPAIHPGAREIRGNRTDEDCNFRAEPFLVVTSGVPNRWVEQGGKSRPTQLGVRDVVRGMRLQLRCSGRGCPFKVRSQVVKRPARFRSLLPLVKGVRLRAGAVLELRILAPEHIGKVVRYPARRNGVPISRVLCLVPGAKRPSEC